MKIDSKSATPVRHVLPLVALVATAGACAEDQNAAAPGTMTSLSGAEFTPVNGQEEMALQAIEATELVQILSLLSGNFAVNPLGLGVPAVASKAIQNAQQALGASCVEVQSPPALSPLKRTVTLSYKNCSGPFQQVTIDGTSTTTLEFDVAMRQFTIEKADNLLITKGGQQIPVTLTGSGALDTDGLSLDTQIEFVDFAGKPQSLSGVLDVSVDAQTGCVDASIAPGKTQGAATLEINDLSVCMDGNVCVGDVSFEALEGAVRLGFDQGKVSFRISGPNQSNPIEASLPITIPSCVNVLDAVR